MPSERICRGNAKLYGQASIAQMVEDESFPEAGPITTYQLSDEDRVKYKPVPRPGREIHDKNKKIAGS